MLLPEQSGNSDIGLTNESGDLGIKDLNKFMEVSVTTLSELDDVLEGVDAYLGIPSADIERGFNDDSLPLQTQTFKKMDLHVVENNFDFSRIHKLQPLPMAPHDIRVFNNKPQPVPIESIIPIRDELLKVYEQRQFFNSYATPMRPVESSMVTDLPGQQNRLQTSSNFLGNHVDQQSISSLGSSNRFFESPLSDSSVKAPWPASFVVPNPTRQVGSDIQAKDFNQVLDSEPVNNQSNLVNFPASPVAHSFPADTERDLTGKVHGLPSQNHVAKSGVKPFEHNPKLNQKRTQMQVHDFIKGSADKKDFEKKDFEVLETSDAFAKVEIFRDGSQLTPISPALSKYRTSSSSGTRAGSTSRLSNNTTRPHSRAQDLNKAGSSVRGAEVFPLPLNRSSSGADMLTSY